ncbi:hypothetical protein D5086_004135 [Populus alba]|uniref:KIB1-4 beta-propeller domain-containing protein n=3 Tax=Populus TaxID=3689 RepID=A0A4U5QH91_POPAL|nr:F-box protein SKIP23-like [Populus alba]KAJ7005733.1 F-box protein SKIP23-like [Populus alba x Populus x berolinensis]TKS10000.1 hypothetical protein D5086_0000085860 [Populus alba]
MSRWSDLPPELLQLITQKQTNLRSCRFVRAVCKSWRSALPKKPHDLLGQLPWLLLPYQNDSPNHRGFYNLADGKTYRLELPESYEKRCCGSSHGWLVMVEETPAIFLLNPLTKARIDLPSLSTSPNFPTEVVFKNSRNLHPSSIRSSKQRLRDRFIRKVRVSVDPSLVSNFMVMAIYGTEHENLAFCASGDIAWTIIRETSPPLNYKDIMFHGGNFFVIDKVGRVSICKTDNPPSLIHVADPPPVPPKMGYKQWYMANLNGSLLLVGRLRKYHVPVYGYETFSFVAYKLEREESKWSEVESLGDKMLFLGWNCSHSVSALDFNRCKGDCIYFTDDNLMAGADFIWEGHDFGVFDFHGGNVRRLGLLLYRIKQPRSPCTFFYEESLKRKWSSFILPPPVWVTISP